MKLIAMTPAEYRDGGKNLHISYGFAPSPFGDVLVASTTKGIAQIAFADNKQKALQSLKACFPSAAFKQAVPPLHRQAYALFTHTAQKTEVPLHVKGTDFQLKVWNALLHVPMGSLVHYGDIAKRIHKPTACRAVGTAIGKNPVAFLIPCHRVIQATGAYGNYNGGKKRKIQMINWETIQKI